jgi:hypothetical protein
VPPRDDVLVAKPQEQESANSSEKKDNRERRAQLPQQSTPTDATLEELKAELAKFPSTRRHSAIVLDQNIDSELTRFCKERGVTVEVFLEAAWLIASAEPELMQSIMTQAKRRYDARKQAGKLRRLITMLSSRD